MAAPTRAEIREALARRATDHGCYSCNPTPRDGETPMQAEIRLLAEEWSEPLDEAATVALNREEVLSEEGDDFAEAGASLWMDLRSSEAWHLRRLLDAALDRIVAAVEPIILEELTAAGVAFAQAHPDAPRPETAVAA